jgi:hypothetical protein
MQSAIEDDPELAIGTAKEFVETICKTIHFRAVEGFPGPVLLVRIPQSFARPHMISFQDWSRFYSHNNSGKYLLDVGEVRSAFAHSETIPERIRRFRQDRLAQIIAGEIPVPLEAIDFTLALHLFPLASLDSTKHIDFTKLTQTSFIPLHEDSTTAWRFNFDGVLFYSCWGPKARPRSYVQVFRTGHVEAVFAAELQNAAKHTIPAKELREELVRKIESYVARLCDIGVEPPIVVMLSLLGVGGFGIPHGMFNDIPAAIDRPDLLLPDFMIEDTTERVVDLLQPTLDALWQSSGYSRCLEYPLP